MITLEAIFSISETSIVLAIVTTVVVLLLLLAGQLLSDSEA